MITEFQEQEALFNWARLMESRYPVLRLMHHIPNGLNRRKTDAARLKKQGVKSGVPGIFLPAPKAKFHGLYIELKQEGDKPAEHQKKWLHELGLQGYKAICCQGSEEAIKTILDYLRL